MKEMPRGGYTPGVDPYPYRNQPIGQVLKAMELISEGHIQEALQVQRQQGGLLGKILVDLGYVAEEEILLALAAQKGVDVIDLEEREGDGDSGTSGVLK